MPELKPIRVEGNKLIIEQDKVYAYNYEVVHGGDYDVYDILPDSLYSVRNITETRARCISTKTGKVFGTDVNEVLFVSNGTLELVKYSIYVNDGINGYVIEG